MRKHRRLRPSLAALVVLAAVAGGATACGGKDDGKSQGRPSPKATPIDQKSPEKPDGDQDPARYAPEVKRYAKEAGVSAQLVMAILYNEAYKPHDPEFEKSWQRMKPDSAFGVANMHRAAYDETKRGRPFANRSWFDLPDDPALAIRAESWHLRDLAVQLPGSWPGSYTKEELMALGYNAGAGNMAAFARGVKPGSQAGSYLANLRGNWSKAAAALRSSG
ncbi:lytic transglycosylase domain-containing protein [Streptomyces huiliensis]|uniref:lytic transglycosylase domain-containing protein n=1 Tax=Streptomyces huiliensis TaxID=2876027 RepID=UPI001CBF5937|nr:lytic transglycosylase domain-containing protein [Streptomyces huiliensis]MBZ4320490.1 lytic transglycosylase domain-containing protein [Streptomyces huiliensis]